MFNDSAPLHRYRIFQPMLQKRQRYINGIPSSEPASVSTVKGLINKRFGRILLCILLFAALQTAWGQTSVLNSSQVPPKSGAMPDAPAPMAARCSELQQSSSLLLSQKKYSEVVGVLERALAICPNRKEVLLALAKAQMLSEQFSASMVSLNTLLSQDPTNVDALMTRGKVLYLLNKDAEADASLKQAIKMAPAAWEPHYTLGRLYYAQSNLKDATAQFQAALTLDPKAYKAYDGLALCYETSGDISDASQEYMAGLALVYKDHPTYDVIYADFAEFLLRYGSDKKAFDLAAMAAARNPGEPRNFYLAGKALYEGGHFEECVPWLERAIQINPLYPDPHNILARAYRRQGKADLARQEADRFRKLFDKAPTVRR